MAKKILVVDDEPDLVAMIKMRLEAHRYAVLTASDGQEGLQIIRKEKPDLIILDILMPKMSGYDLLRALRKEKGTIKDTPVIIVTARGRMKDLFEEIGISDFLGKPFESQVLLDKVERILARAERTKKVSRKALVIGTDTSTIELIKAFLETHNFSVETHLGEPPDIAKAAKMKPDIIFVQSIMKELHGLEVSRAIHKISGCEKASSVIFSSRDSTYVIKQMQEGEILIEYSQPQELIKKIGEYLASH